MLFERMPDLHDHPQLPRSYDVTVHFEGVNDQAHSLTYRLDLDIFYDTELLAIYGEHDAAKALVEIEKRLKKWDVRSGMRVWLRDAKQQAAEDRAYFEEQRRSRQEAAEEAEGEPEASAQVRSCADVCHAI